MYRYSPLTKYHILDNKYGENARERKRTNTTEILTNGSNHIMFPPVSKQHSGDVLRRCNFT